ncbi:MAG: hypothetical protein AAF449_16560, partial [Myxococcota bacterium]
MNIDKAQWWVHLKTAIYVAALGIAALWNLIFGIVFVTTLPHILPDLLTAQDMREFQAGAALGWLALGALPLLFVAAVASLGHRRATALAYGIEAPVVALVMTRLSGARAGTSSTNFAFILGAAGILMFGLSIVFPKVLQRMGRAWASAALTPTLITGSWLSLLLTLFVPPMLIFMASGVMDFRWEWLHPRELAIVGLILMTMAAFLIVPAAVVLLYVGTWFQSVREAGIRGLIASMVVIAIVGGGWSLLRPQPQLGVLELLEQMQGSEMPLRQKAERIAAERERIDRGLLNIVLAPYRYLAPRGHASNQEPLFMSFLRNVVFGAAFAMTAP